MRKFAQSAAPAIVPMPAAAGFAQNLPPGVQKMSDRDPGYAATLLAGYTFGGPITSRVSQLGRKFASLAAGQIDAAFRKHIDAASLSIVKAGDYKAAGVYR